MNSIDRNWVENHIDSNGEVVIPDGIEKIEDKAFKDNQLVKKVIMPDSILEVGDRAFDGCTNLEEVKFSNNIKSIGEDAFFECKTLKNVELPRSIEQIGEEAFARCEELESVLIDIESKIKEFQDAIFYECKNLKTISIPRALQSLGEYSFCECSSLVDVSIPKTLEFIGANAFSYCTQLHKFEIDMDSQLKKIGDHAFYLCKTLERFDLPDTIKTLEKATFAGCYSLSSVDLGNGIETIGYDVFNSCKQLNSIRLPDSLRKIGAAAFINCENLININGGKNIEEIQTAAFEKTNIKSFNVPSQVKSLDYSVLSNCTNLTELYLGENTEEIASLALKDCSNLKKLSINGKISYFPELALEGVDNLNEVEINGTPKINYGSFQGKSSIKRILLDGKEYLLGDNEELFSLQKHGSKVAIVVTDKDGLKRTRCINLEKGSESKQNVNIYLANDGSVVRSINSTADISIEQLKQLKSQGEKKLHLYGAVRDLKPEEAKNGIEYDLYSIDDLIQIKEKIQEVKKEITIPPKEDKHREKKVYSQLVRKLSERMEYDFYEEYNNCKTDEERKAYKTKYEKMTGKNWEEYLNANKNKDMQKMQLEDGNLLGFLNGSAVCRGNVEIIRNIAAEFGIEATAVIGPGHTWNQVKLDGIWYDDDFTNYQPYLAQGNIDKSIKRFLCGQIDGKSEFSKLKLYSRTLNKFHNVGNSYSVSDKKFLLNYGRIKQQTVEPIEKKQEKEKSIRDEVGDEHIPETKSEQQERKEAETEWMNRIGSVAQEVDKTNAGVKGKQEVVQLTQELQAREKQEQTKLQEEQNQQVQ